MARLHRFVAPIDRVRARLVGDPDTECHEFCGKRDKDGYGRLMVAGRWVRAHRVVYEHEHGPTDLLVRHTCDNPPCCNPKHLVAGSQLENMADMKAKGRKVVPNRILSEDDVLRILTRDRSYGYRKELAQELGVSVSTIDGVIHGTSHRDTIKKLAPSLPASSVPKMLKL